MKPQEIKRTMLVWIGITLLASVSILVNKASADIKRIGGIQAFKIIMDPLPALGSVEFRVPVSEPINCKCTTNEPVFVDHGVAEVALTVDNFPPPSNENPFSPGPRISYKANDHDGTLRVGIFCPPVASDDLGFLIGGAGGAGGPTCDTAGARGATTLLSSLAIGGAPFKDARGPHLVQCCDPAGWFIETASATDATLLRAHSHIGDVRASVFCWFRKFPEGE